MKLLVLLAMLASVGCAELAAATNNNVPTAAEVQAQQEAEAERRETERKRAAQEAEYDRLCLDPTSTYQQNWCIERQRAKDRAYAEEQRQAEWAHQERMQQERINFERQQARREAIRRAFDTPPPAPSRSINCTTRPDYMDGSRTTCD